MELQKIHYLIFETIFVDLLGSFVPGIIFFFIIVVEIYIEIVYFLSDFLKIDYNAILAMMEVIFKNPLGITIILIFSYINGFIFFRKDPKVPDYKSFCRLYKKGVLGPHWAVQIEEGRNPLPHDVQYPYWFLKDYLEYRGLNHLARFILWEKNQRSSFRSKHFINILKTKIHHFLPEEYFKITRNEAHVRFVSSIWYMSFQVIKISGCLLLINLLLFLTVSFPFQNFSGNKTTFIFLGGLNFIIIIFFLWIKTNIEGFFHYQRVREIIFVLETFYIAFLKNPQLQNFLKSLGVETREDN